MDSDIAHSQLGPPSMPARLHWRSLGDGIFVSLLISGPTLLASFILRDQREHVWPYLLVIAAGGFALGGAIAGRHRRAKRGAIYQGAFLGFLTSSVIVLSDVIRCLVLVKGFSGWTFGLWFGVEVGSVFFASVGALMGRSMYMRSRKRRSSAK